MLYENLNLKKIVKKYILTGKKNWYYLIIKKMRLDYILECQTNQNNRKNVKLECEYCKNKF